VQFFLSLPGRSEASKEKENRKDNICETQRIARRRRRETFIQTSCNP
jgi:hypothetical protein